MNLYGIHFKGNYFTVLSMALYVLNYICCSLVMPLK